MTTRAVDRAKITAVLGYMNIGFPADSWNLTLADGAIVFCREDPGIAKATATLFRAGRIDYAVLTGGIGKDSGSLTIPEAEHQKRLLVERHGIAGEFLYIGPNATNGAENSRFGVEVILREHLPHQRLILVMHPNNARRVYAVHTKIAREEKHFEANYEVVTMDDPFDPTDPADQQEVLRELIRVADWPEKGWSDLQPDLSVELVAWAREALAALTPKP